jgi:hypothetical protein
MTNPVDRFYSAVSVLAGDGHVKQRLADAYTQHLAGMHGSELPAPLQEPFAALRRRMHSVAPQNGEGPVQASVRKMSGSDAAECAVSVLDLYRDLLRHGGKAPRVEVEREEALPFLVKKLSA